MTDRPRTLVFTGDGKGKTTAALGMVLRASGHGQRCLVLQWLKNDQTAGEFTACQALPGVDLEQTGLGFVPPPEHPQRGAHQQAAQDALGRARRAVGSGDYDLIVLDEVCTALSMGLIDDEGVMAVVSETPADLIVVLTGRGATPGIVELADTVTQMECVKHGFSAGIQAQAGVEY